jgi:solute carrier family 7 (L-type amino acid transporter), member 9/15
MAVAAANRDWFPRLFAVVGRVGSRANNAETKSDAPINAILFSTVLSALYILFGSFRALLTFNGIGEYTFFFLTVVGAIALRYREPDLKRPYKPMLVVPITFALVSGFVVVRGAVFAPAQAGILLGLWGVGALFYYARKRLRARDVL